jgi:2,4-dienoyl-CoA reductase-like NADH-dependent reductase (Old Yellow Enzyme family)
MLSGCKKGWGDDFPVTIKISGDEYIEGGLGIQEMIQIAHLAEESGIGGILVSAGTVGGKPADTELSSAWNPAPENCAGR